jgi:hypothetical protein
MPAAHHGYDRTGGEGVHPTMVAANQGPERCPRARTRRIEVPGGHRREAVRVAADGLRDRRVDEDCDLVAGARTDADGVACVWLRDRLFGCATR